MSEVQRSPKPFQSGGAVVSSSLGVGGLTALRHRRDENRPDQQRLDLHQLCTQTSSFSPRRNLPPLSLFLLTSRLLWKVTSQCLCFLTCAPRKHPHCFRPCVPITRTLQSKHQPLFCLSYPDLQLRQSASATSCLRSVDI